MDQFGPKFSLKIAVINTFCFPEQEYNPIVENQAVCLEFHDGSNEGGIGHSVL